VAPGLARQQRETEARGHKANAKIKRVAAAARCVRR
jgi:hypothetical protein